MDNEKFCDYYCPIPTRYTEVVLSDETAPSDQYADCDLEETECPFQCVDFSKVTERVKSLEGEPTALANSGPSPEDVTEFYKNIGEPEP